MKIIESTKIQQTNLSEGKSFSIKSSPKAFKILSSNLYSNKIRAIIRELSCNAYDSHIDAHNDSPFIVHLPDELNDNFYVQDFGTGLSENDIMNLYTTYFESNKTNSNDFIGALGLGSKSPFSYTDSFMVESIFNKIKTSYIVFIDKNNLPSITKINEEITNEHNGMKVGFSVKKEDWYDFDKEAKYVLSVFDKKPIIKSSRNITLENFNFENDYLLGRVSYLYDGFNVLMGNIIYPVNLNKLNLEKNILEFIKSNVLIIKFEIGDLDITPSREQLSYDNTTVENLQNKLLKCINLIKTDFKNKLDSIDNIENFIREFNNKNDVYRLIQNDYYNHKFPFINDFFVSNRSIYYADKADILGYLNSKFDLRIKSLRFCKYYNDHRNIPVLTSIDNNLLLYFNKRWYISFSNNDNIKFKKFAKYGDLLIEVKLSKRISEDEKQKIIDKFKNQLLIKDISLCDSFENVEKNDNELIKYNRDMSLTNIDKVIKQCHYNEVIVFHKNSILKNDIINGNVFYIPCDKNRYVEKDLTYINWVLKIFKKSKNYDQNQKILLCRNKAIDYVSNQLKIPNYFEYTQNVLKNDIELKNDILNDYSPDIISDNLVDNFRSMNLTYFELLEDENLKKLLLNRVKLRDVKNDKKYIERLFGVEIKEDVQKFNIYKDIFTLLDRMWSFSNCQEIVIKQINLVYRENQK